jgi:hypothetical protein
LVLIAAVAKPPRYSLPTSLAANSKFKPRAKGYFRCVGKGAMEQSKEEEVRNEELAVRPSVLTLLAAPFAALKSAVYRPRPSRKGRPQKESSESPRSSRGEGVDEAQMCREDAW